MGPVTDYSISFRAWHPTKAVREIADCIGLEDGVLHSVGDRRRTPKGVELEGHYPRSYAAFRLKPFPEEALEDFLARTLSETFAGKAAYLKELTTTGGKLEFFISISCGNSPGVILQAELLGKLAQLNVALALDLYPA
jgi:hypothetical protein